MRDDQVHRCSSNDETSNSGPGRRRPRAGGAGDPGARGGDLQITLPAPLAQGASGGIGFDLSIVVTAGIDRFGHDGSCYFIGNALPVLAIRDAAGWHLDPYTDNGESFYALSSDYTVTLDHPSSLAVPATGTSTDRAGTSGRTITTAIGTKVREFAWAAGPFSKTSGTTAAGVVVNVYRVSPVSAGSATSMLSTAKSALDAHAARFGAYPYGEAGVVLDNGYWFGGMEYPGFVLDVVSSTALAHELAHQWFYSIVGDDEYTTPWLDEGFTDYATDLYFDKTGSGCGLTWQSPAEKTTTVADFKAAAQAAAGSTDLTSFWTAHRVEG